MTTAFFQALDRIAVLNPMNQRELLLTQTGDWKGAYAAVELSPVGTGRVRLHNVRALQKGAGQGRQALTVLTGLADAAGVELEGTVKPSEPGGLTKPQLFQFYAKFGFKRMGDHILRLPDRRSDGEVR